MKKLIMLGAIAATVLSGCSNDELYSLKTSDSNAIKFNTFVNKSTRGIEHDITTKKIDKFAVYGYTSADGDNWSRIFNREKVTGSVASGEWTYDNIQYWTTNNTYNFHALAPVSDAWTFEPGKDADKNTDYAKGTIEFTNDGITDLIYAYKDATGKAIGSNTDVEMDFKHLLSRVKFRFEAYGDVDVNPTNIHYTVKDVKLSGATEKASIIDVDYSKLDTELASADAEETQVWDNYSGTIDLNFGPAKYKKNQATADNLADAEITDSYTLKETDEDGKEISNIYFGNTGEAETDTQYLIPVAEDYANYTIDFSVDVYNSINDSETEGTFIKDAKGNVNLPPIAMKKGYSYVYVIRINTAGLTPSGNSTFDPINVVAVSVEAYKTDKTDADNPDYFQVSSIGDITNPDLVQQYDYAMSDGSFVSHTATLTDAQKAACVGIVFWTKAQQNIETTDLSLDPALKNDYPNCTHGLIVSLNDLTYNGSSTMQWNGDGKEYDAWVEYSPYYTSIYNSFAEVTAPYNKDYESITSFYDTNSGCYDDKIAKTLGYNNTKVLSAYNDYVKNNDPSGVSQYFIVQPVEALKESGLKFIPNTSGWYIPSIKELTMIYSGDYYEWNPGLSFEEYLKITDDMSISDVLSSLNNIFTALGSEYCDSIIAENLYLTSTESEEPITVNENVISGAYIFAGDGQGHFDSICWKDSEYHARAVCAF
jgi:hypothetical protein